MDKKMEDMSGFERFTVQIFRALRFWGLELKGS